MNIYTLTDYRKIFSKVMDERKALNSSLTYESLAESIRIQKSYLSKVINGRASFNSDQLFMAARYLDFDKDETEYILLLLEQERSTYPERRELLGIEIEKIRESKRDVKAALGDKVKQMDAGEFDTSIFGEYYMDPNILLTHMFLTISSYREDLESIKYELRLNEDKFSEILKKLEKMGLISISQGKVKMLLPSLHLPRESKLIFAHQLLMRHRSLHHAQNLEVTNRKLFSATFSSNPKAKILIEERFSEFIKDVQKISSKGKPTDCYQLNFDLFPWTNS